MTKGEMIERLNLQDASFDYALPQDWVDETYIQARNYHFSYDEIVGNIIWLYDKKAPYFGRPFPISFVGKCILRRLHVDF